ncbi:MAG: hypothetical protein WCV59_00305 [Parcubacteria group bacterium]|jgi:hypothetical protein
MPDELKSNLEPVDEGELNLKEKFIGGAQPEKISADSMPKKEVITTPENITEPVAETMAGEGSGKIEGILERKEGAMEKDDAYAKIMAKVSPVRQVVQDDEVAGDAQSVDQETDAESKIRNLVNLAETKSVAHAVSVARHMEDNYVLDEFHDRLLGEELHDALVKKGLIKEV